MLRCLNHIILRHNQNVRNIPKFQVIRNTVQFFDAFLLQNNHLQSQQSRGWCQMALEPLFCEYQLCFSRGLGFHLIEFIQKTGYILMSEKTLSGKQLHQALSITSKVKERLQPVLQEVRKHNVAYTFQVFSQIYSYLSAGEGDLNLKFNSLVATKILLDSCEFAVILMVQVYFLPLIKKIAGYQPNLPEKSRGIDYFVNAGYQKSNQTKQLGYNFVRLASEIISVFAIVKPYALYRNEQTAQPSQFAASVAYLRSQGWTEYGELAFYHHSPLKMRIDYLSKLQSFQENVKNYQDFIKTSLGDIINYGAIPSGLDPRRIIEFNESYACNYTLQLIRQSSLKAQAKSLINVFRITTEMVCWGIFQAIYAIQVESIFDQFIAATIQVDDVQNEGKGGFGRIVGTEQEKAILYYEILRSLTIWAVCIPNDIQNTHKQSKSTGFFRKVALQLNTKLPLASNIKNVRNKCFTNMKKNKRPNERWLQQNIKKIKPHINVSQNRRKTAELKQLLELQAFSIGKASADKDSIQRQKTNESVHSMYDKKAKQLSFKSAKSRQSYTQTYFKKNTKKTQFYAARVAYTTSSTTGRDNRVSRMITTEKQNLSNQQAAYNEQIEEAIPFFIIKPSQNKVMMRDISKNCC